MTVFDTNWILSRAMCRTATVPEKAKGPTSGPLGAASRAWIVRVNRLRQGQLERLPLEEAPRRLPEELTRCR